MFGKYSLWIKYSDNSIVYSHEFLAVEMWDSWYDIYLTRDIESLPS